MRRFQVLPAVGRYRQATEAAPDLPEPRFRLAWALVCLGEFGQGVEHLRRGLRIDPDWAAHGPGLLELFGPGQHLATDTILQRVAGWVREEIRDPDRLLMLGVLLHFREDARESREVLETAAALGGETSSARQFLESLNRLATAPPAPRGPAAHDPATREPPPPPSPDGARLGPRTDPPNGRGPAGNDQSVIHQPPTPRSIPTATPRPIPAPLSGPNPGPNPGPQAGGIAEEELEPAPVPHPPEEEAAAPASVLSAPVSPAPVPPAAAPVVRARTGGATSGRSGSRATGAANRGEVRPRLSPPA